MAPDPRTFTLLAPAPWHQWLRLNLRSVWGPQQQSKIRRLGTSGERGCETESILRFLPKNNTSRTTYVSAQPRALCALITESPQLVGRFMASIFADQERWHASFCIQCPPLLFRLLTVYKHTYLRLLMHGHCYTLRPACEH